MNSTRAPHPPNQHQRTRSQHAAETAEDYVEAIASIGQQRLVCRVTDLAALFAVSHVTVSKRVHRLRREGLVVAVDRGGPIQLTEAGKRMARRAKRRHEIVYQFLLALGVRETTATADSEGLEHHVSPETLRAMQRFLRRGRSSGQRGTRTRTES
jgi:DtxR family transcriptional regulator, manganese transport regulator